MPRKKSIESPLWSNKSVGSCSFENLCFTLLFTFFSFSPCTLLLSLDPTHCHSSSTVASGTSLTAARNHCLFSYFPPIPLLLPFSFFEPPACLLLVCHSCWHSAPYASCSLHAAPPLLPLSACTWHARLTTRLLFTAMCPTQSTRQSSSWRLALMWLPSQLIIFPLESLWLATPSMWLRMATSRSGERFG